MKKLIVLSLLTAVMLLAGGFLAPAQAQSPANDLKPTFISPTPGLYVNGWPAFTVSYPKRVGGGASPGPGAVFQAGAARPDLPPSTRTHDCCLSKPSPLRGLGQDNHACLGRVRHGHQGPLRQTLPVEGWHPGPGGRSRMCRSRTYGPKVNGLLLMTKKDMIWVTIVTGRRQREDRGGPEKDCLFPHLSAGQGRAGESAPRCPGVS